MARSATEVKLSPEVEGVYQVSLNPVHGWGKWIRMLGSIKYTVSIQDDHTLIVNGEYPNEMKQRTKSFKRQAMGCLRKRRTA
ncbi:hypothetical protein [Paenibacillus sp. IHB B 3084]|uniref:hypothetical protein n=1 Tax=Paenibacillus sp. IHB B 3084 TaxID=867076 RepID=UPI000A8C7A3D|nr:hypothetical protein [Paenibacillus sp. IHB B 3084]